MKDKAKTRPKDDENLDDTLERQMSTSGMSGIMQKLRQQKGDKKADVEQSETDES